MISSLSQTIGTLCPLQIRYKPRQGGCTLQIVGGGEFPDLLFDAQVRGKVGIRTSARLNGRNPQRWMMTAGLPPPQLGSDLMLSCLGQVFHYLKRTLDEQVGFAAAVPEVKLTTQSISRILREAAVHLVQECDPKARSVALRFNPGIRFRVYQSIMNDPSGRILQLADSCPGALVFGLALAEHGTPARMLSKRFFSNVIAGRPLRKILDEVLKGWIGLAPMFAKDAKSQWTGDHPSAIAALWEYVGGLTGEPRSQLCSAKRLLIERAGRRVAPTYLIVPPPIAFCPEDIPTATLANAHWYALTHEGPLQALHHPELSREDRLKFSSFMSRHAAEWSSRKRNHVRSKSWLVKYVRATGDVPSRKSSPQALLKRVRRWRRTELRAKEERKLLRRVGSTEPFPIQLQDFSSPELKITQLRDAAALQLEGHQMGHCVGQYVQPAQAGEVIYLSATVRGKRLTLQLSRLGDGEWHLGQVRGKKNRDPSEAEMQVLQKWVRDHLRRPGAGTQMELDFSPLQAQHHGSC